MAEEPGQVAAEPAAATEPTEPQQPAAEPAEQAPTESQPERATGGPATIRTERKNAAMERLHSRMRSEQGAEPAEGETGAPTETETETEASQRTKPNRAGRQQPIDEQGRYQAADEAADDEADTQTTPEGGAVSEQPDSEAGAETQQPAEGMVRIPLPEGHSLRDQGREFIDVPAHEERAARALVNSDTRRATVEEAQQRAQEAEEELARLRARNQALSSEDVQKLRSNPELIRLQQDMQQAGYSDEAIKLVTDGIRFREQQALTEAENAELTQLQQVRHARSFLDEVAQKAPEKLHVWNQMGQLFGPDGKPTPFLFSKIREYAQQVDHAGGMLDVNDFLARLEIEHLRDPRVQQHVKQWAAQREQKIREQARREREKQASEQQRENLADAASRHATNPHGRMSRVETGERTPRPEPADEIDAENSTPSQIKKARRRRALDRARAILPG